MPKIVRSALREVEGSREEIGRFVDDIVREGMEVAVAACYGVAWSVISCVVPLLNAFDHAVKK